MLKLILMIMLHIDKRISLQWVILLNLIHVRLMLSVLASIILDLMAKLDVLLMVLVLLWLLWILSNLKVVNQLIFLILEVVSKNKVYTKHLELLPQILGSKQSWLTSL